MTVDTERDDLQTLVKAAGLELSAADLARVAALHDHLTTGRALLAATPVGETEPATIFEATRPDERR